MAEGEQVDIPRLLSREATMWMAVVVALVGAVGVVGWGIATQAGTNLVMAVVLGVVLAVAVVAVVWRRTWVDTGAGTIHHRVALFPPRSVAWAEASVVDLERNRAGQLALRVRGGDRTLRVTVLAIDPGGERSMRPEVLRLLAHEIDRWAPERQRLTARLRAQAEHVEVGAALRESPLARHL